MYSKYSSLIAFDELPDPSDVYDLGSVLGEGTYGSVYKAIDRKTGNMIEYSLLFGPPRRTIRKPSMKKMFTPVGVPGLRLGEHPTTIQGQTAEIRVFQVSGSRKWRQELSVYNSNIRYK